ncbi:MAG: hypothetical protein Q4Q25_00085 [Methanocorpusculum sp.]|nr:hypothetical protein [Methanocorpusculum sp.]
MTIKYIPSTTEEDKYLKTNTAGYKVLLLAVLFVFAGLLSWLFFGSYNITVQGYADVEEGIPAYLCVPAEDIDKIKPGMTVAIGNSYGTVQEIAERYGTYEDLKAIYGPNVDKLHVSPDKSYYSVTADITEEPSAYAPFTVVIKTVSPIEYFSGGMK